MPPQTIDYASLPCMTVEEYLAFEEESDVKHEYAAGYIKAMAGARRIHETVALNLATEIHRLLKGSPCTVFKSDMKLRADFHDEQVFYYPDVMVSCEAQDNLSAFVTQPKLIIEVSTEWKRDFIEKFAAFTKIPSLEEYVIVWADEKKPSVTLFRRANGWEPPEQHTAGPFTLRSINLTLNVEDLYLG
ncbi:MAG: Uma2 family endonuclease [Prosthecobacter sp.]|nr:Uma2 family endonuclease [Prosthecobacter sp.]